MADTDTVVHDVSGSRFLLMRGERQIGEAGYVTEDDGKIVFTHTNVDLDLKEKGLGSILVKGALDQMRSATDARIGATCPFVVSYLERHPEYEDLTSR